jgi:hypothetical protein
MNRSLIALFIWTNHDAFVDLAYNRQEKMNIDVKEFQNKVTVVRANGRQQSWVSVFMCSSTVIGRISSPSLLNLHYQVEAGLGPGQRYSRSIVNGSGLSLEIVVCENVAGSPDYAVWLHNIDSQFKLRLCLGLFLLIPSSISLSL